MVFKRKRTGQGPAVDAAAAEQPAEAPPEESPQQEAAPAARLGGPFDVDEVSDTSGHLDFGALLVPQRPDVRVGLDQDQASKRLFGVTMILGGAAVQLRLFAAPRSGGYWEENRKVLLLQLQDAGGRAVEADGPYGIELRANVPGPPEQSGGGLRAVRFVGVEGPRWLLRGAFTGEGADPAKAAQIEEVFRSVVVVRGADAMPVGAMLMLRMPPGPSDEAQPDAQAAGDGPTVESLEPGDRITEVR